MKKRILRDAVVFSSALWLLGWAGAAAPRADAPAAAPAKGRAQVTRAAFGSTPDGQAVELFTLTNARGLEARVINYGGIIVSLRVPDRAGHLGDIVLGHDDLKGYVDHPSYFGCIVGRYGNRIAKGLFVLDGTTYRLATNNGPNHLHGGKRGFDKVVWKAEPSQGAGRAGVVLTYTSPDGEEGYPGTLAARVTYTLTDKGELAFEYFATTDKPTPVNLTQHSYFNLAGEGTRDVLDHQLTIDADRYTPVDATLIPTGALAPVAGTPFDFRKATAIGERIGAKDEQIARGGGYDHNYVLNRKGPGLAKVIRLAEPTTGRVMEVSTTEPGVQFYSGNFLDGTFTGKAGHIYRHRYGLCLETQHFPDSPNQPSFPSTILRPGAEYRSKTVLTFSTAP
jgi:aldose 1-epimerase